MYQNQSQIPDDKRLASRQQSFQGSRQNLNRSLLNNNAYQSEYQASPDAHHKSIAFSQYNRYRLQYGWAVQDLSDIWLVDFITVRPKTLLILGT